MTLPALHALRERIVERFGLYRLAGRRAPFGNAGGGVHAPADRSEPDVTVLIPAFQHERYIVAALRSVLAQSHPHFTVVVADDCSTDRTVQHARAVSDPRITVTENERNLGLGGSIAAALDGVTTPFVALLNSDDLFHPDRLRLARQALLADTAVQVVATGVELVDSRGRSVPARAASRWLDGRRIFHWVRWYERVIAGARPAEAAFVRLLRTNFLLTSSNIVCRTEYLRAHQGACRELKYCLDWHIFLTAAADDGLRILPEKLVGYRLHSSNTVWFTPAQRPAYSAEVNDVVAAALTRHLAQLPTRQVFAESMATARCIAANNEIAAGRLDWNAILPATGGDDPAARAALISTLRSIAAPGGRSGPWA